MAKKPSIDRGGPDAMRIAGLLKVLETTPDAKLAAFLEQRCPKEGATDVTRLGHARDLLDAIGDALESTEDTLWLRLDAAWRVAVDGASEARAAAELAKAEAASSVVPKEKRAAAQRSSAKRADAASAKGSAIPKPSLDAPQKPPSVFSHPASVPIDAPMPARGPSPWANPSAASRRDESPAPPAAPPAVAPSSAIPSASAVPSTPAPASGSVDETQALDSRKLNLEPLPFKGSKEAPEPGAGLVDLPPVAASDVDATSVLRGPLVMDETMPFLGGRSLRKKLAAEAALVGRTPVEPAQPPDPVPSDPPAARAMAPTTALPASPPLSAERGALTLEQYASLCASCDVDPEHTADIERRFGVVNTDARRKLDAQWQARLRADGTLYRAFYGRFHEYRGWLIARRGSSSR